jgi:adenylate cyclase
MNIAELQKLNDWLIDGGRSATSPPKFMAECCERMVAAGLPLWRVGVFVRTLHPEIYGRSFIWKPGAEVEMGSVDYHILESPEFNTSPLKIVFQQGLEVRVRADDPKVERFPIVDELRAEGVTDYIALPLPFIGGAVNASSWTTKEPGGFTDEQLVALRSLSRPLARVVEIISLNRMAASLLDTYVGNSAGERIMGGQIRRGHTETMNAAIWLSDLRGFTRLSDMLPPKAVVDVLNLYFDCQVEPIVAHGGEVLKFMGDGLLAVFPIAEGGADAAEVCGRVLAAARDCRERVAAMNFRHGGVTFDKFRFGLALHVGEVLYGNIGGGHRLDFTCIGPAVNLAARLEKIASDLNRIIIASEVFAAAAPESWLNLGEFPIAGFRRSERVYGLTDEALPPRG